MNSVTIDMGLIRIVASAVLFFSLLFTAPARSNDLGIEWKRFGVVLDLGEPVDRDERGLESPLILRETPDRLVMWYRGRTFADEYGRIMRATSNNGIDWTRTGVVMEPRESHEGNKIDPMAIALDNDEYKMWYGGQTRGGNANLATSPDGINWTRSDKNPVLEKTRRNWDSRGAGGQHSVFRVNDEWNMIYKGYGHPNGWTYYGLAISTDGERWKKKGRIVSPDPDVGESTLFRNPHAFFYDGRYFLIHAMAGRENLNLRVLHSDDGREWNRSGILFQKGMTPGGFDAKWATSCNILIEGGLIRMWYEGGDPQGKVRILYAEADEEEFFAKVLSDH